MAEANSQEGGATLGTGTGAIELIGFDADDTLWHNEPLYAGTQARLEHLLAPYLDGGGIARTLFETEMRNLHWYGYGIKSFALSMIETAIQVSAGRISGSEVRVILDLVREMLEAPVQLLDYVADVIPALAHSCQLMLITKGDLRDQEVKLERSGLAPFFGHVEIVRDKTEDVYWSLLQRFGVAPQRFLMVGNSLRSDVLPVVTLGGHAVHIPYHITWEHERAGLDGQPVSWVQLEHIGLLPVYVQHLCQPQH
jgi:putative hydrolase of the HAD superfamily